MNIQFLDDKTLLFKTAQQAKVESQATALFLKYLQEVERRVLYATQGFSSLFDYVTRGLGYSEGAAYRRIQSMRLMSQLPEVEDKIASGEIDLTKATKLNSFFRQEEQNQNILSNADKLQVIEEAVGKSSRELEKDLGSKSSAPPEVKPKEKKAERRAWTEYRFTGSEDFKNMEQELRAQWAHRGAGSWSLEKLFFEAMKGMVEINSRKRRAEKINCNQAKASAPKVDAENIQPNAVWEEVSPQLEPQATATATSAAKFSMQSIQKVHEEKECGATKPSRYVPRDEVRKIFARDGESCSYTDPQTGKRCGSKWKLELDHKVAFAHAGENTSENMRVYCRTHNRRHAVEMGLDKVPRR